MERRRRRLAPARSCRTPGFAARHRTRRGSARAGTEGAQRVVRRGAAYRLRLATSPAVTVHRLPSVASRPGRTPEARNNGFCERAATSNMTATRDRDRRARSSAPAHSRGTGRRGRPTPASTPGTTEPSPSPNRSRSRGPTSAPTRWGCSGRCDPSTRPRTNHSHRTSGSSRTRPATTSHSGSRSTASRWPRRRWRSSTWATPIRSRTRSSRYRSKASNERSRGSATASGSPVRRSASSGSPGAGNWPCYSGAGPTTSGRSSAGSRAASSGRDSATAVLRRTPRRGRSTASPSRTWRRRRTTGAGRRRRCRRASSTAWRNTSTRTATGTTVSKGRPFPRAPVSPDGGDEQGPVERLRGEPGGERPRPLPGVDRNAVASRIDAPRVTGQRTRRRRPAGSTETCSRVQRTYSRSSIWTYRPFRKPNFVQL